MNKAILNTGVQDFIEKYSTTDILAVALGKSPFEHVSPKELAQQLSGKKKSFKKFPFWNARRGIYYPKTIHLEQASSEATATYKANLISGKQLVDLTGGMGVDTYYLSRKFNKVVYCEKDRVLAEITAHNFSILDALNIDVINRDGIVFLKSADAFDYIFIDPSRRDSLKKRVFKLADCEPPVPELLPLLFSKSNKILLKAAPMLDIRAGLSELENVSEVHVVAVDNEVKELLFMLEKDFAGEPKIITANIQDHKEEKFSFLFSEERAAISSIGLVPVYLYQPNAAIMKAGAFRSIGSQFGLHKLHRHSHLYSSDELIDFPGRRYRIRAIRPYKKSELKKHLKGRANIATRNFHLRAKELYELLGIKPGGDTHLFFTIDNVDKRIVIECTKIK